MRHYAGSAMMLLVTTAVIVSSYTINLKVAAERTQVQRLTRTLARDAISIRDLQAELRTRARLPEMQRWNDNVLLMSAPAAGQYLRSPVQLAGFAVQDPADVAGSVAQPLQRAVTAPVPVAVRSITAPIVRVAYRSTVPTEARPEPRIVNVAYRPAMRRAPPLVIIPDETASSSGAPVDLLHEGGQ